MSFEVLKWASLSDEQKQRFFTRSELDIREAESTVKPIIEDVRQRGDAALSHYARKFDGADLGDLPIKVTVSEFKEAEESLDHRVKKALEYAIENVRTYHRDQRPQNSETVEVRPGIFASDIVSPIDSVGLYVPRGRVSFPSMLYMLAVPAVLAGVKEIAISTPPLPDGKVDPACLYAAQLCGVTTVYRAGGAQAMAAFAYGTETVKPVCKVIGPGSMYVTAAKRLLSDFIDPGLPAGPSESIVLADGTADPYNVAIDLFIEAEHGSDSAALLLTDSLELARQVSEYLESYIEEVPEPRRGFIKDVFNGYGGIILTESMQDAADLANTFATEHLQIQASDPKKYLPLIRNAGEILLGCHTPFSLANYATGANAVLPTGGKAKTWSSVSVRDFVKYTSVVEVSKQSYGEITDHVEVLADYEGFFTHANALRLRRDAAVWKK